GVERRMVFGEVQRVEVVALGLGFRPDRAREAQLAEDVADLVHDLSDEVQPAAPLAPAGHREIEPCERGGAALQIGLAPVDGALEVALQRVGLGADALARLRIETGKGLQDFSEGTSLAAQELGFELLETSFVCVRDLLETLPQRF
ncbi:MAG TPA: hypothetical protein VK113_03100, partial [Gemmatimonadales bacterium]|nr:hypothetical protein [Gemmatimonadales bacterium]